MRGTDLPGQPGAPGAPYDLPAEPPLRRVLVVVDGSAGSGLALAEGIALARRERAVLTVAAVIAQPSAWATTGLGFTLPVTRDGLRREAEAEAARWLAYARDAVPADVSVVTRAGTRRALAREAAAGGYDLVVVGRARRSRWAARSRARLRADGVRVVAVAPAAS